MTPQQYFDKYQGQSLLYAPSPAREYLRGQCVQGVCFFVAGNGKPVLWVETAFEWWSSGRAADQYERIPNSPTAVPQPGDLIVWDKSLANSGNAGHIAVCLYARPSTGTFVSVDTNWGGKTIKLVTHNYDKVVGWMRFKSAAAPAQAQGDEMIANTDQADRVYKMLRPNGSASQDEINGSAGKRSYAQFVNDAQPEIAARDANLRAQADLMRRQSDTINAQNQTITDLTIKLNDANVSGSEKQKALDDALGKMADQNAQITTCHDEIVDLQNKLPSADPAPDPVQQNAPPAAAKPGILSAIILALLKLKKK